MFKNGGGGKSNSNAGALSGRRGSGGDGGCPSALKILQGGVAMLPPGVRVPNFAWWRVKITQCFTADMD